jgi:hypothetical protein
VAIPVYKVHERMRKEGKSAIDRRFAVNELLKTLMRWACIVRKDGLDAKEV